MPISYKPVSIAKASDLIIEEIWASILNGDLKAGERLPPERELVTQFGVSKVTLREALQSLEANGYIERKRGAKGGSIVKEISPTKGIDLISEYLSIQQLGLDDLINARLLIEPMICEQAARVINDEKAHQLELMLDKHQQEFGISGKSKFGLHFEQYLARLTDNLIFIVIEDLLVGLVKQREEGFRSSENDKNHKLLLAKYYGDTFAEHKIIVDAIVSRNESAAKSAMIAHRRNWARTFRELSDASHQKVR